MSSSLVQPRGALTPTKSYDLPIVGIDDLRLKVKIILRLLDDRLCRLILLIGPAKDE